MNCNFEEKVEKFLILKEEDTSFFLLIHPENENESDVRLEMRKEKENKRKTSIIIEELSQKQISSVQIDWIIENICELWNWY